MTSETEKKKEYESSLKQTNSKSLLYFFTKQRT